eukprot:12568343-Prorocentrum_lima.AAC.1
MCVAPCGSGVFDWPCVPALKGVRQLVAELVLSCGSGGGPVDVSVCCNPRVPGLVLGLVDALKHLFSCIRWQVQ